MTVMMWILVLGLLAIALAAALLARCPLARMLMASFGSWAESTRGDAAPL